MLVSEGTSLPGGVFRLLWFLLLFWVVLFVQVLYVCIHVVSMFSLLMIVDFEIFKATRSSDTYLQDRIQYQPLLLHPHHSSFLGPTSVGFLGGFPPAISIGTNRRIRSRRKV